MQPYGYDTHALPLYTSTFLLTPSQMSPFFSIPASSRRPRCVTVTTVFFKLLDTEAEAMKKCWHGSRRREVGGFPGLGGLVVGWPMHRAMKCKIMVEFCLPGLNVIGPDRTCGGFVQFLFWTRYERLLFDWTASTAIYLLRRLYTDLPATRLLLRQFSNFY